MAIVLILTGAFNGGSNTKFPMYITTIGIWGSAPFLFICQPFNSGGGIAGVWIAIALDNVFRAVFLLIGFKRGRWVKKQSNSAKI